MKALEQVDDWPVSTVAVAVVTADGSVAASRGPLDTAMPLASVCKMITGAAVLLAVEEGAVDLDTEAGPPGSTVRHLLAHASGCHPDNKEAATAPETKRVYSNAGYEWLGDLVAERTGIGFPEYVKSGLLHPLGMHDTVMHGSPAADGVSSVADLVKFAAELQAPQLLHSSTLAEATKVAYPGLEGLLPGFGVKRPNDWGLGWEIRGEKDPHWTGTRNSPATFGHFGRSGTFLWVDPDAGVACVCLTDRDFGDWSRKAWPQFADAVLDEMGA
jgi:CubicO group peptidase (beta-lactamase class C family)